MALSEKHFIIQCPYHYGFWIYMVSSPVTRAGDHFLPMFAPLSSNKSLSLTLDRKVSKHLFFLLIFRTNLSQASLKLFRSSGCFISQQRYTRLNTSPSQWCTYSMIHWSSWGSWAFLQIFPSLSCGQNDGLFSMWGCSIASVLYIHQKFPFLSPSLVCKTEEELIRAVIFTSHWLLRLVSAV